MNSIKPIIETAIVMAMFGLYGAIMIFCYCSFGAFYV